MDKFSFKKGFDQLQGKDQPVVKDEIMAALGIKTRQAWWFRLNGKTEPKMTEVQAIENIFAEYNITEIWGVV